jgi:hypothetical protein
MEVTHQCRRMHHLIHRFRVSQLGFSCSLPGHTGCGGSPSVSESFDNTALVGGRGCGWAMDCRERGGRLGGGIAGPGLREFGLVVGTCVSILYSRRATRRPTLNIPSMVARREQDLGDLMVVRMCEIGYVRQC